jgi:hypothetical protein
MPIFTRARKRCLFIHIPKTGGTSVEHSLGKLGWQEQLLVHGPLENVRHFRISPQHFHGSLLDQIVSWDAIDLTLTLCRHPFERLKSEYYWQQNLGTAPAERPEEWLALVLDRYAADVAAFDNHLRPQLDFLPARHPCEIFRLEDNGVNRILKCVDTLQPASWVQQWRMRSTRSWQHRSAPSPEVEKAFAGLRERIETFYSADMAHFGY